MALTIIKSVMLLVLLHQAISLCEGSPWFNETKERVQIMSYLNPPSNLTVHCKSKQDDLGEHVINPLPDSYAFKFTPPFFGHALFFCTFQWPKDQNLHWFDIYDERRDYKRCKHHCCWFVQNSGPCMGYNDGTNCIYKNDSCSPWKQVNPH
ncbi:hypothetical protein UlMin_037744 [Ulmus minor]